MTKSICLTPPLRQSPAEAQESFHQTPSKSNRFPQRHPRSKLKTRRSIIIKCQCSIINRRCFFTKCGCSIINGRCTNTNHRSIFTPERRVITTGQGLITTEHRTIIKQQSTITNGQGVITPSASTTTKCSLEMNTNGCILFALLLGLSSMTLPITCRPLHPDGTTQQPTPFLPLTTQLKPDLDPATPVAHLSPAQRRELMARLYRSDQRYREELHLGKKLTPERKQHLHRLMRVNDEANTAILLNLVKTHGWPQPRTASDSTGFKACVLVWHITAYDRYRPFEPYLPEKVKNQRLILANPPQSLAEKRRGWK